MKYFTSLALYFVLFSKILSQSLIYPNLPSDQINDLHFISDQEIIMVNSSGGIYKSYDGGKSWMLKAYYRYESLAEINFINHKTGFVLPRINGRKVIFTTDAGETWSESAVAINPFELFLPLSESLCLKATFEGKIERLDNFFNSWVTTYMMPTFNGYIGYTPVEMPYGKISNLLKLPSNKIIALCDNSAAQTYGVKNDSITYLISSEDLGISWDTVWAGFTFRINQIAFASDSIGWMAHSNIIYKTTNGGKSWKELNNVGVNYWIENLTALTEKVLYANTGNEIIKTTDGGINWEIINFKSSYENKLVFNDINTGFILTSQLHKTINGGIDWVPTNDIIIDNISDVDFINLNVGFGFGEKGLYKTTDGGKSWSLNFTPHDPAWSYSQPGRIIMINENLGWLLHSNEKLFQTKDGGQNWEEVTLSTEKRFYNHIDFYNENLGVIIDATEQTTTGPNTTERRFHLVTTDGGTTWKEISIGTSMVNYYFDKIQFLNPNRLLAVNTKGLWISEDTAKTWIKIFDNPHQYGKLNFHFYDMKYGVVTTDYVKSFVTANGGNNWYEIEKPSIIYVNDCALIGHDVSGEMRVLEAGHSGELLEYYFNNNGQVPYVRKLTTYTRNNLNKINVFVKDNFPNVWIVGNGFTTLFRQFEKIVSVSENEMPVNTYSLSQNYPNPFNPSTTIEYVIPNAEMRHGMSQNHVTLKIYDILGREIATLVNEYQLPGKYSVQFNVETRGRESLPSGIYFYRLHAGKYSTTRKMILLK